MTRSEPTRSIHFSQETTKLLKTAARHLPRPCHLVGGALRDALLDRPTPDLDLTAPQARQGAQILARHLKALCIPLDHENGVYRIILDNPRLKVRQIDICETQGANIQEDLQRRDFTLNALALPISEQMSAEIPTKDILDPRGGMSDISRRIIRTESEEILKADPLRILRAFRIAAQLDFTIEPGTLKALRRQREQIRRPAAERICSELTMLLSLPHCSSWLRLMDETGVLTTLFDDLEPSRQCAVVYYGTGGVLKHTLNVISRLDFLLAHLNLVFPDFDADIRGHLSSQNQPEGLWRVGLMLAALLHDVSKPETAKRINGRLRFFGHDARGAQRAAKILKNLRFPKETIRLVEIIIANHLRPGNLAAGAILTDKAVYRFFRDLRENAVKMLLVCWADHASYLDEDSLRKLLPAGTKDPSSFDLTAIHQPEEAKTLHHLQIISQLLRKHFSRDKKAIPQRIISGLDVMKALGIPPGPPVGMALEKVREAQAEGLIANKRQALAWLRSRAQKR